MKEDDPLSSKESSEVKIELSQDATNTDNNSYDNIKPLPLP